MWVKARSLWPHDVIVVSSISQRLSDYTSARTSGGAGRDRLQQQGAGSGSLMGKSVPFLPSGPLGVNKKGDGCEVEDNSSGINHAKVPGNYFLRTLLQ